MERKIVDKQIQGFVCPEVATITEIKKVTTNYVIFNDYVYDARNLEKQHPGGYKVIELVRGREVDRFIYGMYSAELYPELAPYSHSMYSLELVGNPIAKLITPPIYEGFEYDVTQMKI
mgnify:CR=1 FL=1